MKDKVRLDYVDKLKGLAILLVVAGHVTEYSFGIRETIFNRFYGNIHVPLFFFISGYFAIKNNEKGFFSFLKGKVAQLIFPTLLWGGGYGLHFWGKARTPIGFCQHYFIA